MPNAIYCDIRDNHLINKSRVTPDMPVLVALLQKQPYVQPVPVPCLAEAAKQLGPSAVETFFDGDRSHVLAIWARSQRRKHKIPETGKWQ